MAKLITVGNQKGGVGKTTLACHLAFAAHEAGRSVLLVDFDTQGNASQFLSQNMKITKNAGGSELLFGGEELIFGQTPHSNIKLLHGHKRLQALDVRNNEVLEMAIAKRREMRKLPFDYVIFDTPANLGPRLASPLFWSDIAILAIKPSLSSMVGLEDMFETIGNAKKRNPILDIRFVINMMNRSSGTQKKECEALHQKFGKNIIGEFSLRQHVADALDNFKPVWNYTKDAKLKREWKEFTARALAVSE
ncbi:ParA family protein [Undibacterium arcticum]|uniref:ParA family protein n=1 Tax=Undibacterium arcticum TaxID=1762892 RepID=A0ABV7FA11_9BURK